MFEFILDIFFKMTTFERIIATFFMLIFFIALLVFIFTYIKVIESTKEE